MDDKTWQLLMDKIDTIGDDVKDLKKEMGKLRIKVAVISSGVGALAVTIREYFQ